MNRFLDSDAGQVILSALTMPIWLPLLVIFVGWQNIMFKRDAKRSRHFAVTGPNGLALVPLPEEGGEPWTVVLPDGQRVEHPSQQEAMRVAIYAGAHHQANVRTEGRCYIVG